MLWLVAAVAIIAGIFAAGVPIRVLIDGRSLFSALSSVARTIFGQIQAGSAGLVLALLGIAIGHDMYYQQFTMLKPLSREKREEVKELTHTMQPLIEARHMFGRTFTPDQLRQVVEHEGSWGTMAETLSSLEDQGIIDMRDGVISVTAKGENLLSVSRFVGGLKERGEEGADLCAYCGKPLRLSEKLMRVNYRIRGSAGRD